MIHADFSLRYAAHVYSAWVLRFVALPGGLDVYQIAFSALILAVLCGLALAPRAHSNLALRSLSAPWFYCFLMLLALYCARLPTFLPPAFNPDEAQFVAGALKLKLDPVFWRSIDGGTSGPLNYYGLLLLNGLGMPLDFATARLLNVLCMGGAVALVYPIARFFLPDWAARLASLPAYAAVLNFRDLNFLHYSSECIATLLIAAGVWLLFSLAFGRAPASWKYLALGTVVALLPFSKLQSVPMAIVLGGAALAHVLLTKRWASAGWLTAGFASIWSALWMALAGCHITGTFWDTYVVGNLVYADIYQRGPGFFKGFLKFLFNYPDTGPFETGVIVCLPLAAGFALLRNSGRFRPAWFAISVSVCLLLASFYAIYRPARFYPHYLNFLIFPYGLIAALAFAGMLSASPFSKVETFGKAAILATVLFLGLGVAGPAWTRTPDLIRDSERWMAETPQRPEYPVAVKLHSFANPGDVVAIWGWAASYYVFTATISSSRDVITAGQIQDGPLRTYYRRRFIDDLRRNPPKVFVDAVAPGQFGFQNRAAEGYETFPELRELIATGFDLTGEVEGVRFFCRRPAQKP